AFASGGPRTGQDDFADEVRLVRRDQLGDHPSHGETEQVDLLQAERPDEGDGVPRHRLDRLWRRTTGRTDAPVVEGDDAVLRSDAVDDSRVPAVEHRGQ